jgi:hypothetical protein
VRCGVIIIAALPRILRTNRSAHRKRGKELGLSGYSRKNKSELVSMLRNH